MIAPMTPSNTSPGEAVGSAPVSDFPQLIRHWREEAGLSLSQAGKLAGITKAHLWDMERGTATNPTIRTLAGLANAYGASLPYLAFLAAKSLEPSRHTARPPCPGLNPDSNP